MRTRTTPPPQRRAGGAPRSGTGLRTGPASGSGSPTFDVAERWTVGRGDGASLYVAGDAKRRVRIADFGLGGRAPGGRSVAADRATVAAQAPRMYLAILELITNAREDGSLIEANGRPHEGHGPGCACALCDGLVALALAEGGGRCIVCGCTEFDACHGAFGDGCAWEDHRAQLLCTAHPPDVITKAKQFLARGGR